MNEFDVVRVVRIERSDRVFDGTYGVSRPPNIGDTRTYSSRA